MAEEANEKKVEEQTEKKVCGCAKGGVKVIIGIALIILGLWAVIAWLPNLWVLIKGCIGLILIIAGAITIAIAKE